MAELIVRFPCPLHYGLRFNLECVDCMGMPAVRPDGTLIDGAKAITTEHQRRWARQIFAERKNLKDICAGDRACREQSLEAE